MDELIQRLNSIPNSYYEFVDSVVDYAKMKGEHLSLLIDFLDGNPNSTPSDIIKFISFQPDFFEDSAPVGIDILAG